MHGRPVGTGEGRQPEDILIAWLLWLPRDADVAMAAVEQVARIDRKQPLSQRAARLRELLLQLVEGTGLPNFGRA
jgi:hypothetical protein